MKFASSGLDGTLSFFERHPAVLLVLLVLGFVSLGTFSPPPRPWYAPSPAEAMKWEAERREERLRWKREEEESAGWGAARQRIYDEAERRQEEERRRKMFEESRPKELKFLEDAGQPWSAEKMRLILEDPQPREPQ